MSNEVSQLEPLSKEALDYLYGKIQECISKIEHAQRDFWQYWNLLDSAITIYENETGRELPDEVKDRIEALRPRGTRRRRSRPPSSQ